jgi:hypothetical protein
MNLDTDTTIDPVPAETPIEQAAQQLAELVTQLATTTTTQADTHDLTMRAENAEREYARLCTAYETLVTQHNQLKQQLTTTGTNTAE